MSVRGVSVISSIKLRRPRRGNVTLYLLVQYLHELVCLPYLVMCMPIYGKYEGKCREQPRGFHLIMEVAIALFPSKYYCVYKHEGSSSKQYVP